MIIPVDRDDLVKLLGASAALLPEVVKKYDIHAIENLRDANGDFTENKITFNLNNILVEMTNGKGEAVKYGDPEVCRSYRFRVKFVGLSEEDNIKATAFISKVELPILDYGNHEVAQTKISFYNASFDTLKQ